MLALLKSLRSRLVDFLGSPSARATSSQGSDSLGIAQFSALTRP